MRRAQDRARSTRSRKNGARSATIESRALGALKLASEASCAQWECACEAGRFFFLWTNAFTRNSWDLKDSIKNIIVQKTHSLISLDVVSMFDSIPLDLALDCVEEKLHFNHNLTKVSKNEIIIATRTVFNNMVFSFNNKFYKQTSGCPMGSPLSPIVSNLVLEDVEKRALSSLDFVPLLYKRYVDDICYYTNW